MTTGSDQRRGQVASWAAVVVAAVLLSAGGVWYRAQAARFANYSSSVPLPAGTLARLPMKIGPWTGRELPMTKAVVEATKTDDRLSRVYAQQNAPEGVSLFIGYGVRLRDLMPHRPEVCYPGAGWTMLDRQVVDLKLADGSTLPCRVLLFRRGGLSTQQVAVLDYYIIDGRYWPDVELLREKASHPEAGGHYVAQIEIACTNAFSPEVSGRSVREFAGDSAATILKFLTNAVATATKAAS